MGDGAGTAPGREDRWLTWEVAGKPVLVRISRDVAGRLRAAVGEGFRLLPRRGLETGGFLLGTTREMDGKAVIVEIDDFEPLECEHSHGPSYVLSESDLRRLEARIALHEDPESPSIVGFYRSHTRSDFTMTVEDLALFAKYFPAASHVFLLIKANEDGPPTGGFIIREGGKVLSNNPYPQFPLPRTDVVVHASLKAAAVAAAAPAPARTSLPVPAPTTWRTGRTAWTVWLATGVVALGIGIGLWIGIRGHRPQPAGPVLPLALSVANNGNSLRLSWDRSSRRGGNAVLWIRDGLEEQRYDLDARQLAEGSVVYWPRNNDVNFRLEWLSPGAPVAESIRSIGGPAKPPDSIAEQAPVAAPAVPAVQATVPAAPPKAVFVPALLAVPRAMPAHLDRAVTASRRQTRAFVPPPPEPGPARAVAVSLPDPPPSRIASSAALHDDQLLQRIAPSGGPSRGDGVEPPVRVSVEPVEHVGRNLPLIGKRYRRPDYIPPAPLRSPAVPELPQRTLARNVSIDVKVYVNPAGKVDYAEVLSNMAQTDHDLAALAVFSARRWEFVPARTGTGAVPGEVILRYRFSPGGSATERQTSAAR